MRGADQVFHGGGGRGRTRLFAHTHTTSVKPEIQFNSIQFNLFISTIHKSTYKYKIVEIAQRIFRHTKQNSTHVKTEN